MDTLQYQKKTKLAIFLSSLLSEPLFTVYGFVALILCKDLHATALQISILTMLRPVVSIFSFYWSAGLAKGGGKNLRSNIIGAGLLGRLPFLFFPLVNDPWYVIGASAVYMLFFRAGNPAWIEILKLNMPSEARHKSFSLGHTLSYLENIVLTLAFGAFLDKDPGLWRILFFSSALLGMLNLLVFARLPINYKMEAAPQPMGSLKEFILRPWKTSWELCRNRPDFARFQWGFMLAGFGIMVLQPAIPMFLVDKLHITYMDFGIALSLCKGLGITLSSPLWARAMNKLSIFTMARWVFFLFSLFPLFLIFSPWNLFWLYLAYTFYGIGQGGSHLVWNLSGPSFSGKQDSSIYSGVNVMMVGLRGAVAPPFGGFLTAALGPFATILCAIGVSVSSVFFMKSERKKKPTEIS